MGWTDPTDPEFFEIAKHLGSLCLIAVNEYVPSITTSAGTSAAVRAEVAVIDGPNAGARFPDAMFFGKKIVPQLKASLGSTILGRIGHGEKQAGKNAPYIVEKATAADAAKATEYVKAHGDVNSHPVQTDTSMASSKGYAPDPAPREASTGPSLPEPPPYPGTTASASTYTQPAGVGGRAQDDEPPF